MPRGSRGAIVFVLPELVSVLAEAETVEEETQVRAVGHTRRVRVCMRNGQEVGGRKVREIALRT
jgi:hypothetical protein